MPVSGRTSGRISRLTGLRAYSKMVAPGALPGDKSVERIPAVQRGPGRCHLHALRKPLTFSCPPIIPVETFAAPSRILVPGSSENQTLVYGEDAFPISLSLPPSCFLSLSF